jgi:hypothetical protein
MQRSFLKVEDFSRRERLLAFEGGAVYTAEHGGRFYLIQDESTLPELLSDEDLVGLELVNVLEFESKEEREVYLVDRGWANSRILGLPNSEQRS